MPNRCTCPRRGPVLSCAYCRYYLGLAEQSLATITPQRPPPPQSVVYATPYVDRTHGQHEWRRLSFTVPFPKTDNHLYTVARGRKVLTEEGRQYQQSVIAIIWQQRRAPLEGPLALLLDLHAPDARRRDLFNFNKALLDACTQAGLYHDDSQIQRAELSWGTVSSPGYISIIIEALTPEGTPRPASRGIPQGAYSPPLATEESSDA